MDKHIQLCRVRLPFVSHEASSGSSSLNVIHAILQYGMKGDRKDERKEVGMFVPVAADGCTRPGSTHSFFPFSPHTLWLYLYKKKKKEAKEWKVGIVFLADGLPPKASTLWLPTAGTIGSKEREREREAASIDTRTVSCTVHISLDVYSTCLVV